MIRLKRILVATDFSPTSDAALKYGIELATAFNAELHLLNIPENPGQAAEAEYPIGLFENMRNAAYDRLGRLLPPEVAVKVRAEFSMRIGIPADEITKYASERDIDLIVIGTHGRTGIAHAVMGSVAEKVVRKGPCPVLTIHNPEHEFIVPEKTADQSARATV
jgi:nucleotide-binding universal stress UspA family protein